MKSKQTNCVFTFLYLLPRLLLLLRDFFFASSSRSLKSANKKKVKYITRVLEMLKLKVNRNCVVRGSLLFLSSAVCCSGV
jgi:hypothetical protein